MFDALCRIACDSQSPAAILYQPSSRQAVLVRCGDVIPGRIRPSKCEPGSTRARACVDLELVACSPQAAPVQQFVCKHDDVATLRRQVMMSFGDMEEQVQVLGDCK